MAHWNAIACGELAGDKTRMEYFDEVEKDRYRQQPWQHGYFGFDRFSGRDALEIGIGQGTDLLQFAKAGARCHGADITENHLALTARNFALHGFEVDLRRADGTALPFADGSMDCVYSFGVIHHIPDADRVIAEAFRVLRPGGEIMIAYYYKWSAFHLVKKLLFQGLFKAGLIRLGYAGLLATIETGADGKTVRPYVKLYSRSEVRRQFDAFEILDISVHQFSLDHVLPAGLCGSYYQRALPFGDAMGWYVTCRARRPVQR